jgi:hypothetical protein
MPGPVSDSYDPVWGSTANQDEVTGRIRELRAHITHLLGNKPVENILGVLRNKNYNRTILRTDFTLSDLRLIRFICGVALDEEDI